MKKIIVLGATGRIGKLLLPLLTDQGHEVTAFVRNNVKAMGDSFKNVNIIEGDVLNTDKLSESFKDQDIVVGILSGDLLAYAQNIVKALDANNVRESSG